MSSPSSSDYATQPEFDPFEPESDSFESEFDPFVAEPEDAQLSENVSKNPSENAS